MPFVVTSIPKGTFRVDGTSVALAATVLGNIEYNILGTKRYIPHLKFVGVHFCEEGKDCKFKTFVVE